jgi:hypothetical protein
MSVNSMMAKTAQNQLEPLLVIESVAVDGLLRKTSFAMVVVVVGMWMEEYGGGSKGNDRVSTYI